MVIAAEAFATGWAAARRGPAEALRAE